VGKVSEIDRVNLERIRQGQMAFFANLLLWVLALIGYLLAP
jgi:hypothetical protein